MGITLNVNFEAMKEQIEKIVKQLCKHNINKEEAVNELLNLHSVIGCINEHYESAEIKCGTTNKTLFFAPTGLRGVRIKESEAVKGEIVLEITL